MTKIEVKEPYRVASRNALAMIESAAPELRGKLVNQTGTSVVTLTVENDTITSVELEQTAAAPIPATEAVPFEGPPLPPLKQPAKSWRG